MSPAELTAARAALGALWGLGRPLRAVELGRLLRGAWRDPGRQVLEWESGKVRMPGAVSVAVEMMLAGSLPPDFPAVLSQAQRIARERLRA